MRKVLSKLLQSVLIMFIVSILCFVLVKAAPGDPVMTYVQPNMSEAYIETLRENLGLTKPLYVAVILSIPLGLFSGKYKNGILDKITSVLSYVGISIPNFWFGILLIYLFSVYLGWLPSIGMHSEGDNSFLDLVRHLILPCSVMTFVNMAQFTRYIRSSTITELSSDYVMVQTAYGMSETGILFKHVLKNAMLPMITVLGMSLQSLVSGAMICEQVFSWPGTGQLAVTAVTTFDYPLIMGITMLTALLIVVGNLLADILYTIVDPRIRHAG